jgi:hypothetical protein
VLLVCDHMVACLVVRDGFVLRLSFDVVFFLPL